MEYVKTSEVEVSASYDIKCPSFRNDIVEDVDINVPFGYTTRSEVL